ncbi:hypothetical protein NM208_g1797 [Fusarium decemcellulare]|uniref:Uncharacterized protein n=1 Tax=Fusarium decemcellulare TaxID=57161 RepID=A0ACC1SUM8_9HYPO|nr:hypothetical protein NM208_g1797 [Fusarium decemcellulare]
MSPNDTNSLSEMNSPCAIHPSSQLCHYCKAIPWRDPSSIGTWSDKSKNSAPLCHYESLFLLQESADSGCILCRHFWTSIILAFQVVERDISEVSLSFRFNELSLLKSRVYIIARHQGDTRIGGPIFFEAMQFGEVKGTTETEPRLIRHLAPNNLNDDLRDLIATQIQPWIRSCGKQQVGHELCDQTETTKALPTRLLDVGKPGDDKVKIVTPPNNVQSAEYPYLILSYCWGDGNDDAKTTTSNLEQRLTGFEDTSLPKTIRDAIKLTRMMGFRYLWVDAICIIQSSRNHDLGDFEKEAKNMRDYYANAECCISASLARDSSEGFLQQRPAWRFPIHPIVLAYRTPLPAGSQSWVLKVRGLRSRISEILMKLPLRKRGWYLQELLLSPRILHWTPHFLLLQCRSGYFLEGSQERFSIAHDSLHSDPRKFLEIPDDKLLTAKGWPTLLEFFSRMDLSYPKDRLYAIDGIARLISQRLDTKYFYGIFGCSLAQGLAWHYPKFPYRPNVPRQPEFPTWCWASNGQVNFETIPANSSLIQFTRPRPLTAVETSRSKLHVTVPLLHVTLSPRDGGQICRIGHDNQSQQEYRFRVFLDNECVANEEPSVMPSWLSEYGVVNQEATVQVVLLSQADLTPEGTYIGLLVKQMNDAKELTFQRYALIRILTKGVKLHDGFPLSEIILE